MDHSVLDGSSMCFVTWMCEPVLSTSQGFYGPRPCLYCKVVAGNVPKLQEQSSLISSPYAIQTHQPSLLACILCKLWWWQHALQDVWQEGMLNHDPAGHQQTEKGYEMTQRQCCDPFTVPMMSSCRNQLLFCPLGDTDTFNIWLPFCIMALRIYRSPGIYSHSQRLFRGLSEALNSCLAEPKTYLQLVDCKDKLNANKPYHILTWAIRCAFCSFCKTLRKLFHQILR